MTSQFLNDLIRASRAFYSNFSVKSLLIISLDIYAEKKNKANDSLQKISGIQLFVFFQTGPSYRPTGTLKFHTVSLYSKPISFNSAVPWKRLSVPISEHLPFLSEEKFSHL